MNHLPTYESSVTNEGKTVLTKVVPNVLTVLVAHQSFWGGTLEIPSCPVFRWEFCPNTETSQGYYSLRLILDNTIWFNARIIDYPINTINDFITRFLGCWLTLSWTGGADEITWHGLVRRRDSVHASEKSWVRQIGSCLGGKQVRGKIRPSKLCTHYYPSINFVELVDWDVVAKLR